MRGLIKLIQQKYTIVSSIGSVYYGVSKEVARIIKPLVGSTEHYVNNSKEFIEEIKKMKLEGGNV